MKKTIFRVTLFEGSDDLCEKLVAMAAKANGGAKITLKDLKTVSDGNTIQYPILYGNRQAEIIGENILHIDRKIGEDYKTVCVIEQVDVVDLKNPLESALSWDDEIPEGMFQQPGIHNMGDN